MAGSGKTFALGAARDAWETSGYRVLGPVLEQRADEFTGATLLGRTGEGHEIGGTAVFLASRASGYITGSVLAVDGGLLTNREVPEGRPDGAVEIRRD